MSDRVELLLPKDYMTRSNILVVGNRGSGKSELVKKMILRKEEVENITIISNTEKDHPFYSKFVETDNIYYKYDSKILENLMNEQSESDALINKYVILDDCVNEIDSFLNEFLLNCKEKKIYVIVCVQHYVKRLCNSRKCFDYVFMFGNLLNSTVTQCYESFCESVLDYSFFIDKYNKILSKEFSYMIVDNTTSEINVLDQSNRLPLPINCVRELEVMCHSVIVGGNRPLKAKLMKKMIENANSDNVIIISRHEKFENYFTGIVPQKNIHNEYKDEIIDKILKEQEIKIINAKKNNTPKKECEIVLILDECLSQKGSWAKSPGINELLFNGRHYHIGYILSMAFPMGLTPDLRCNFDNIYITYSDCVANTKRIYDHYAGVFPNYYSFNEIFKVVTKENGIMMICCRGVRSSICDKVFSVILDDPSDKNKDITVPEIQDVKDLSEYSCPELDVLSKENNKLDETDRTILLKVLAVLEKVVNKIYD
ncbi:P-loop NTPase domain protein [Catovirus CTV1]|uniref:p-loop NTPase domain protein n=1 Tax=Catovirus CTV1 TaxID=1977631 RepID=A0A1V0SAC5_9VIRU|nr:P-loop NTPase domain protein [Catovirus CTV1]